MTNIPLNEQYLHVFRNMPVPLIESHTKKSIASMIHSNQPVTYNNASDTEKILINYIDALNGKNEQFFRPSNTTYDLVDFKNKWTDFYTYFQRTITNETYNKTVKSLANPSDDTQSELNRTYYDQLFGQSLKDYDTWKGNDANKTYVQLLTHTTPSEFNTNYAQREKNVIFWQITRILDILMSLQQSMTNQSRRLHAASIGMKKALTEFSGHTISKVEGAGHDEVNAVKEGERSKVTPSTASKLQEYKDLEKAEQLKKNLKMTKYNDTRARSNIGFTNDAHSSHFDALEKFWSTMDTIMRSMMSK